MIAIATPLHGPGAELGLTATVLDQRGFVVADQALRISCYATRS